MLTFDRKKAIDELNEAVELIRNQYDISDDFVDVLRDYIENVDLDDVTLKSNNEKHQEIESRFRNSLASKPSNIDFIRDVLNNKIQNIVGDNLGNSIKSLYYNTAILPTQNVVSDIAITIPQQIERKFKTKMASLFLIGGIPGSGKTEFSRIVMDGLDKMFKNMIISINQGKPKEELQIHAKSFISSLSPIFKDAYGKPVEDIIDIDTYSKDMVDNFINFYDDYKDQISFNDPNYLDTKNREKPFMSVPIKNEKTGTIEHIYVVSRNPFLRSDDAHNTNNPDTIRSLLNTFGDSRSPATSILFTYNPEGVGLNFISDLFNSKESETQISDVGVKSRRGLNRLIKRKSTDLSYNIIETNFIDIYNKQYSQFSTLTDFIMYHHLNNLGDKENANKILEAYKDSVKKLFDEGLREDGLNALTKVIEITGEIYNNLQKGDINKILEIKDRFFNVFNKLFDPKNPKLSIPGLLFKKYSHKVIDLLGNINILNEHRIYHISDLEKYIAGIEDKEGISFDSVLENIDNIDTKKIENEANGVRKFKKQTIQAIKEVIDEISKNPEDLKKIISVPKDAELRDLIEEIKVEKSDYSIANIYKNIDGLHKVNNYGVCKKTSHDIEFDTEQRTFDQAVNHVYALNKYIKDENIKKRAIIDFLMNTYGIDSPITEGFLKSLGFKDDAKLLSFVDIFDELNKMEPIKYKIDKDGLISIDDKSIDNIRNFLSKIDEDITSRSVSEFADEMFSYLTKNLLSNMNLGGEPDFKFLENLMVIFSHDHDDKTSKKMSDILEETGVDRIHEFFTEVLDDIKNRFNTLNIDELGFTNEEKIKNILNEYKNLNDIPADIIEGNPLLKEWQDYCKKLHGLANKSYDGDTIKATSELQGKLADKISDYISSNHPIKNLIGKGTISSLLKLTSLKNG